MDMNFTRLRAPVTVTTRGGYVWKGDDEKTTSTGVSPDVKHLTGLVGWIEEGLEESQALGTLIRCTEHKIS